MQLHIRTLRICMAHLQQTVCEAAGGQPRVQGCLAAHINAPVL